MASVRALYLFERASGAKVNPDKSVGLWLGAKRGREGCPMNVQWTSGFIKVLGVSLGQNSAPLDFWEKLLDKVELQVRAWQHRALSLKGKIIVIKQLLLPVFVYPSFILVSPPHISKHLQVIFDSFVWRWKAVKIARHILELPVSIGGLFCYPTLVDARSFSI